MADEDEWKKLPTEEKVQHKNWKARAEGYKECIKKFPMWDEKSSDFSKYLGLIKKFVTDSNELNRIQGLQAALVFVSNAAVAGKTCVEVVSGVVSKCFNTKPRLREAGMEVCLMYVEIDKNEQVQDEVMKGFDNKQPKIVQACVDTLTTALNVFGSKVISVKPLIKQTIKLLDHRDKNVRESAKSLFIEIYRWIGPAIRGPLQNINAVALKDLEEEWDKVGPGAQAKQSRFMRSQQDLREKMEAKAAAAATTEGGENAEEEAPAVDAYDLLEPVEILSRLPKTFFTQIEEKKWQERKMALQACEKLITENPKLQADDYADLVKALKKVLSKDTNILLVVIAVKCLGGLASGLRKKFQPYALVCLDGMFERFKEKKANVVAALQDAVDAVYLTTNIQAVSETVVEALGHKNPSIRCQVGLFLSRALVKTKAAAVNKALVKLFVQALCKNIDHSSPEVREASFQAIGAMLKLVGDAKLLPFLVDLDKLKMDKINECAGKAELSAKKGSSTAPAVPAQASKSTTSTKSSGKPVEKSKSKENAAPKVVKGGKKPKSAKQTSTTAAAPVEAELSDDVAAELVLKVISEEEQKQVLNNNWKERLAGLQAAYQQIRILEKKDIPCQAFVKLLSIKPGWKDSNFNCLIEKFKILTFLAENGNFSKTSANICLLPTTDKIADVKCGASSKAALTAISEATGMPWVSEQVLAHAMAQKNPKIQSESLAWLSQAVCDFGVAGLNVKLAIEKIKVALAASNPAVRNSAFALIGTLAMFMGEKIRMFFESEKPALLQQIDAEMEKVKGQPPPAPCRGVKKQGKSADGGGDEEEDEGQDGGMDFDDMLPRTDISAKITDGLVAKLNDKNWKIRKEGLDTVIEILNEAKLISANLGDLPTALKTRLSDSNKILVTSTLNILSQLSVALGPHSAKHVPTLSAGIINALADSKPQVRQAALKCLNTWVENSKISMWLEGDTIATALSNPKHTFLRIELFNWLSEKLMAAKKQPPAAREGLEMCVAVVYSCCEDRSGEVRAKAQAFLPALIRHLTYEKLIRATGKLPAQSKTVIMPLLDKAKELVPAPAAPSKGSSSAPPATKPSAPAAKPPPPPTDESSEQPAKQASTSAGDRKTSTKKEDNRKRAPSASRKAKQSEEDTSPMFIPLPNGKEQRMKDEAKLKTIKWQFAAPRDELVTQLQQQLSTCVGSSLMTELFHADFQHHLKAIAMLQQALSSDWNSTVNCVDILLRWFTLRFYDKNTTVHIKSLEYLKALFDKLIENDYRMSEYEASAFLPHLLIKIGENKDNIRKAVCGILKQITLVYSSSKLFTYVMDGIKSKNARQRSECLDQIGLLIETYGVGVCQPSPGKALKEIAANISDRDKGVRSAALNALVAAYNVSGEIVYKQVGRLSEKDMSMLEERIKRSGKYVEGAAPAGAKTERIASAPAATNKTMKETKSVPADLSKETATLEKSHSAPGIQELKAPADSPPKKWLPDHIREGMSQLKNIDIDHLLAPLPVPEFIKHQEEKKQPKSALAALDISISQISSTSPDASLTAAHELFEIIKRQENHNLLTGRVEQLLTSSTTQLRMLYDRYLPLVASNDIQQMTEQLGFTMSAEKFNSLCKTHIAFLMELFSSARLSSQLSMYSLYDFFRTLVPLMVSDHYASLPSSNKLIQLMNMLVLKCMDGSDPTAVTCAIFRVLFDSMESGVKNYFEISVKCIWKLARQLPEYFEPKTIKGFKHEPIKVAPVLAELDRFWSTYPRHHAIYTRLNTDMPLRSIKTVVMTFCKQPGVEIMNELYMITNPDSSDIVTMIEKAMGKTRASRPVTGALDHKKENLGGTPPISLEIKLSGIFKKIGDRQLTKQGILELHEFKQAHPHYDVASHIDNLEVEFFRDYVKRGLQKYEDDKFGKNKSKPVQRITLPQVKKNSEECFTRLNRLRANCGLEPLDKEEIKLRSSSSSSSSSVGSKVLTSNSSSLNQPEPIVQRSNSSSLPRAGTAPAPSSGRSSAPSSSSSLLDLKRRLEQIKQNRL